MGNNWYLCFLNVEIHWCVPLNHMLNLKATSTIAKKQKQNWESTACFLKAIGKDLFDRIHYYSNFLSEFKEIDQTFSLMSYVKKYITYIYKVCTFTYIYIHIYLYIGICVTYVSFFLAIVSLLQ